MKDTGSFPDYHRLVEPTRVHSSLYTDPEIFQQELDRIWYRTWVYVGHESEVPQPDDFVLKSIGPQPVIMTRDRDGRIHLLQNRCPHRGNQVCMQPKGNARTFHTPRRRHKSSTGTDLITYSTLIV